jgi:predicted aconitase with swiveling domain
MLEEFEGYSEGRMRMKCRTIVRGVANGEVLTTRQAINFLTMIDLKSGVVKDDKHELYKNNIANKILVFPNAIGSSVGAYSIYALKINNVAPKAIVCNKADITTASGCAIANIPLVDNPENDLFTIKASSIMNVDAENGLIEIAET